MVKRTGKNSVVPAGNARTMQAKKLEAQQRVLALLAQGHTITDSMRAVDRNPTAFHRWCKEDGWFKQRADIIRNRDPDEDVPDFERFRKAYFGFDTYWHQRQIIDAIEATGPGEVTMILLPPAWGKTSVEEDYINYLLGPVDPNLRICVISEAREHGKKILGRVAGRMTDDGPENAYVTEYGPFRAPTREAQKRWNTDRFTVLKANSGERDFSLEVKSAGSAIYGARYDYIFLDDIQSTNNLNATPKLLDYFHQDVYTRILMMGGKGKIIIIGTRVGANDFYESLLVEGNVDHLVRIPARDEEGNSNFPKRTLANGLEIGFDEEDLADIERRIGHERFAQIYMQEARSKRGQTFTDDMIENAKDTDRSISIRTNPGLYTIAAIDPALAGHAAIRVASYSADRLFLLDGANVENPGRYEVLYEEMRTYSARWHPSVWIVESNNIQGGIARDDRLREMSDQFGFRIVEHQSGRNKADPTIGVASMDGAFLRREIRIPWGDTETRDCFAHLPKELKAWRADVPTRFLVQDEVMCLWFLYLYWQKAKEGLVAKLGSQLHRSALPYRPTRYAYAGSSR